VAPSGRESEQADFREQKSESREGKRQQQQVVAKQHLKLGAKRKGAA
jgi:hypothetical protein